MHACRHARAPKPAHGSLRAAARGSVRSMSAPAQGRGQQTHAFTHALETGHHMYMKLADGRVYCLPEGYEVDDRSLDAIRYVLNPTFAPGQARRRGRPPPRNGPRGVRQAPLRPDDSSGTREL